MKAPPTKKIHGYAMLEVLISILVIAFGLLGLAGLQGNSIRNNHNAYLRNQATLYAYDIADRMRANREGLDGGFYNSGTPLDTAACHPTGTPSGCTPAQMAGYDLFVWGQILSRLPNGSGIVCRDSTPATPACDGTGVQYIAKITWTEATTTAPPFDVVFQP